MNLRLLAAVPLLLLPILPAPAEAPAPTVTLRYQWAAGQMLTFLVQQDPYFADPGGALAAAGPDAAYLAPMVTRLTEQVQSVARDGTATLKVTSAPAPGFEDEAHPETPTVRTVTVSSRGEVSGAGSREIAQGFPRLPAGPVRVGASWAGPDGARLTLTALRGGIKGLAIITQTLPPGLGEARSPDHDGTLLQTTRTTQSGRIVFDLAHGQMARRVQTLTVTASLVMTGRGQRGVADFGRVVPNVQAVQTLTMERQANPDIPATPASAAAPPSIQAPPNAETAR